MSFSDRTRERIRNFSRRFNPDKPPSSSIEAVGNIPTVNGAHPRSPANTNASASTRTPTTTNTTGTTSTGLTRSSAGAAPSTARTSAPSAGGASSALSSTSPYHLRPPKLHRKHSTLHAITPDFVLPDLPWLCGTWHVTHSTLPMWKNKRNVRITYTRLPGNRIDDVVTYQADDAREVHRVHGVDSPKRDGRYVWRGKGLLKVASSSWEVLGWGGGGQDEEWVVTYFYRTMFTPAGIDIYSRSQNGLSQATLAKLRKGLGNAESQLTGNKSQVTKEEGNFSNLVNEVYPVQIDGGRDGDEILVEAGGRGLRG